MKPNPKIYFCADDFGMTPQTCDRILACNTQGCLNKIGVLSNTELPDIKERLQECGERHIAISVHLNLVEGRCLCNPSDVSLLVNENGYFKYSFTELLKVSMGHQRRQFQEQVKREFKAQIERAMSIFPEGTPLQLDSHQHVYMIPAIFSVVMQIIEEEQYKVSYMRIPAEPLSPYFMCPSLYGQYVSINLIKQWVLRIFNLINRPKWKRLHIPTADFFGVLFSGNMSLDRVCRILPHYIKRAEKRNRAVEVLFHPGYMEEGEHMFDPYKTSFHQFYLSSGRKKEYDAMHCILTKVSET